MVKSACVLCALAGLASPSLASVSIPVAAALPLPGIDGDGLNAGIWATDVSNVDDAEAAIAANPADATFHATRVAYPTTLDGSVSTDDVASFLGSDLPSLSPSDFGAAPGSLDGTVFRFTGFIRIDEPGEIRFGVYSDDGYRLRIGGEVVGEWTGLRGPDVTYETGAFGAAGLYPIELTYFETAGGEAGVNLIWSGPGSDFISPISGVPVVPTAYLYSVPAPSAPGLLGVAVLAAGRRRR